MNNETILEETWPSHSPRFQRRVDINLSESEWFKGANEAFQEGATNTEPEDYPIARVTPTKQLIKLEYRNLSQTHFSELQLAWGPTRRTLEDKIFNERARSLPTESRKAFGAITELRIHVLNGQLMLFEEYNGTIKRSDDNQLMIRFETGDEKYTDHVYTHDQLTDGFPCVVGQAVRAALVLFRTDQSAAYSDSERMVLPEGKNLNMEETDNVRPLDDPHLF